MQRIMPGRGRSDADPPTVPCHVPATDQRASRRNPTASYIASFVVLGTVNNLIGPALTTLQGQVDTSVRSISALFAAQSLGYLVGSLAGGRGYDRSHGKRLFAGALFVIVMALIVTSLLITVFVPRFDLTKRLFRRDTGQSVGRADPRRAYGTSDDDV